MKIEVGKKYRLRGGRIALITHKKNRGEYTFFGEVLGSKFSQISSFTEEGYFFDAEHETPFDIVEEYNEE